MDKESLGSRNRYLSLENTSKPTTSKCWSLSKLHTNSDWEVISWPNTNEVSLT